MQPNAPSEPKRYEIGVLYGFRALMVLFVAWYHFWQQSWLPQYGDVLGTHVSFDYFVRSSYLFVDGMLLMSGLLLFLPYAREQFEGIPAPSFRRFYENRVARIVPSYVFAVLMALFLIALPQKLLSGGKLWLDLLSHLTFTQVFFREPYLYTPLNAALWTVAVEMQFYILFPLLVRCMRKWPAWTLWGMALVGVGYRTVVGLCFTDTAMLINQMPAFLDVYALGMLGAMGYVRLRRWMEEADSWSQKLVRIAATFVFVASILILLELLRTQSGASAGGHAAIRIGQLQRRLPLSITLLACMLSASMLPKALQWLFSNRLMRFLSAISFNYYIWHQVLAVQMKAWFPDTLHTDIGLQWAYTLLCVGVSLMVAMSTTNGLEVPLSKQIHKLCDTNGGKRK